MIDKKILDQIARLAIDAVVRNWKLQGHDLTGKFAKTIDYLVKEDGRKTVIEFLIQDYGAIANKGVPASRIPYSPGSGKKTSKYIEKLIDYALKRMTSSEAEATKIAFAIASKHKKEGMPTNASKLFSQNGKRIEFIDDALKEVEPEIILQIQRAYNFLLTQLILQVR